MFGLHAGNHPRHVSLHTRNPSNRRFLEISPQDLHVSLVVDIISRPNVQGQAYSLAWEFGV